MTNSLIEWNCRGLRPNCDEFGLLIDKHNPLEVCLQKTLSKDTDDITVGGCNLYHKLQEMENRASILANNNITQSVVAYFICTTGDCQRRNS